MPSSGSWDGANAASGVQELALKYEGSSEFNDFPKSQYGIAGNWDLGDGVGFAAEYLHGNMDRGFSTGDSRRDTLTTRLAIEF